VLFSAAIQDPASSAQFPSGRLTELYAVPANGGAARQYLATPARNLSWAPDGKSFVYEDVKGFEDVWRKHHTSSVTRDIWRYTPATGKHERLIDRAGEYLSPVDDGKAIYFLSERAPGKSLNVYRAENGNYDAAKPVTAFKTHPVRFLSRANNGTMAFTYDGEIYTMTDGTKPVKTPISIKGDFADELRKIGGTRGATGAQASPNGKLVAFLYRGDVFVTPVEYATTKQISDTPEAESDLSWGNDSTLYYTSERDGKANIYRATIARAGEEPDLAHATLIKEEPVFKADGHERTAAQLSPDGKKLAFILDRTKLAVMDMKSKKVTMLTDGSTHRQRNGRFYYTWSPDSRWIALEIIDRKHDPYSDVAIINVEDGKLTNITNSGYFDAEPKWIMGGDALAFSTERLGMRNHASWGSQMDVFFVFMNRDAYDRFMLPKEERELLKNGGKKEKNDTIIKVEYDGLSDRQVRITPMSTDLRDQIVDSDGKHLYFISSADDGSFIWDYDLEKENLSMKRKHPESAYFDMSADGKSIFLFGGSLNKFGDNIKPISYRV